MDDRAAADLTRLVEDVSDRLARVEGLLDQLRTSAVTADRLDGLAERSDQVSRELAALRRLDIGSRFHHVDESMQRKVNRLEHLGDQWAELVNPQLKPGRLRDLNQAVDRLDRTLKIGLSVVVIALVILTVVTLVA